MRKFLEGYRNMKRVLFATKDAPYIINFGAIEDGNNVPLVENINNLRDAVHDILVRVYHLESIIELSQSKSTTPQAPKKTKTSKKKKKK